MKTITDRRFVLQFDAGQIKRLGRGLTTGKQTGITASAQRLASRDPSTQVAEE